MLQSDHKLILENLIGFKKSLTTLKKDINKLPWDNEVEMITLQNYQIIGILKRYINNKITTKRLVEWANLIECREDIGFSDENIQEIIFMLANPTLSGITTQKKALDIIQDIQKDKINDETNSN